MKTNDRNCLASVPRLLPANRSASRRVHWWKQLRFSLRALEFLLARHQRLGWTAELDRAAFDHRVAQLQAGPHPDREF